MYNSRALRVLPEIEQDEAAQGLTFYLWSRFVLGGKLSANRGIWRACDQLQSIRYVGLILSYVPRASYITGGKV
jgi:hypothetical protein